MTVKKIQQPFDFYHDDSGNALKNGKVYFGIAGQDPETNPITVYWDSSLTTPASQPIRTLNGYLSNNGNIGNLYISSEYSITVRDKNDNLIFTQLTSKFVDTQTIDVVGEYIAAGQDFSDVITFLNANSGTTYDLVFEGQTVTLDASVTMPSNARKLIFGPDGSITFSTYDLTLTLQKIYAPNTDQIFIYNSTGVISGSCSNDIVYPEWWGAVGDGLTDDLTALNNSCVLLKKVFLTKVYAVSGSWVLPVNISAEFTSDAEIKQLTPTPQTIACNSGTTLINPRIDNNNIKGANGIGVGGKTTDVENVYIFGGLIRNCIREEDATETFNGGGRGIMVENDVYNVSIIGTHVKDSTAGFGYQGTISKPSFQLIYSDIQATNCMHALEFFGLSDFANTPDSIDMGGIQVNGGVARNCGLGQSLYYSGTGSSDGTETGVIISERGRHIEINDFRAVNDSTYGKVGAFFRGTGMHIKMNNCRFYGESTSIIDITGSDSLLPIGGLSAPPSFYTMNTINFIAQGFYHIGTTDYIYSCNTPSGVSTGHQNHRVIDFIVDTPATGLIDVPTARSDAYMSVTERSTGKRVAGSFNNIVSLISNAFPTDQYSTINNETFYAPITFDNSQFFMSNIVSGDPLTAGRVFQDPLSKNTLRVSTGSSNPEYIESSKTYDPPSIASGSTASTTITLTGAELGDYAIPSFSLDLAGLSLIAYVNAADTVTAVFTNNTGSPVDLSSGTLRIKVIKS